MMKNLKKIVFFAIAVFAFVLSSSCSSDDAPKENPDEIQTKGEFIKFKYKGTSYSFEPGVSSSLNLLIKGSQGIDNTYKSIGLWMPLIVTKGSHPIVLDLSKLETTYQVDFAFMPEFSNVNATSGTMNITLVNSERIEGTFNFSATKNGAAVEVTEGSFSVKALR
jgi:hypothetical protein